MPCLLHYFSNFGTLCIKENWKNGSRILSVRLQTECLHNPIGFWPKILSYISILGLGFLENSDKVKRDENLGEKVQYKKMRFFYIIKKNSW